MHDHPEFSSFSARLKRLKPARFRAVLYRASEPMYANTRDLLAGVGSQTFGGRWNPPASMPTIYLARTWDGALLEVMGISSHYAIPAADRLPMTLVAVDAEISAMLDFSDARCRRQLTVTLAAMKNCPWRVENQAGHESLTQCLGRAAAKAGIGGIIVPSALRRGFSNVIVFPENLGRADRLTIRRPDRLVSPGSSGQLR